MYFTHAHLHCILLMHTCTELMICVQLVDCVGCANRIVVLLYVVAVSKHIAIMLGQSFVAGKRFASPIKPGPRKERAKTTG